MEPVTGPKWLRWWWVPDAAFAALRIAAALLLVLQAGQELFGLLLPPGQAWLGQPVPMSDRWIAGTPELGLGALLAAGLFTRTAAFGLAVRAARSCFAAARARGHWALDGVELIVFSCCVLLAFAVMGPGLFSLDALFFNRRRVRTTHGSMSVPLSPWIRRQYRRRELAR